MKLIAKNIHVFQGVAAIIEGVDLALNPGELVAILGPNGAGKTTLLRAALGFVKLGQGAVTLGGDAIDKISPIERARRVAYLPQIRPLAWPNIVKDVVALGRYSHGARLGNLSGADAKAVDDAIAACDILHLSERAMNTLSGGELARVHCARAFAAGAPLLIADEPVAALDPLHQHRVMSLIKNYVHANGHAKRGAMVVLHDIGLAARYADRLIWMKEGRVVVTGSPEDTLSVERLADIYGVKARITGSDIAIDGAIEAESAQK